VQHDIGDHALLAGGGTAALVDPEGGVTWLPWPRIDAMPVLRGIVDEVAGGGFSVGPARGGARTRRYRPGTLLLETDWECAGAHLEVAEALVAEGPPRLARLARARGGPVEVVVRYRPAGADGLTVAGTTVHPRSGGEPVLLTPSLEWRPAAGGIEARLEVGDGEALGLVLAPSAGHGGGGGVGAAAAQLLEATTVSWRRRTAPMRWHRSALAERVLGAPLSDRLLKLSGGLLLGLTHGSGGIVAAPTTSLPQWPGSSRTWDYRFAWLRDTSLAALAMLRLGLPDAAAALGDFCGRACQTGAAPPVLRVDGSRPPPEIEVPEWSGYRGARPVRLGNAAATQAQVDVLGEVLDLADALDRAGVLPDSLQRAVPGLAAATLARWAEPDHGIWEVRGPPRIYTHSRLMAWTGLRRAAALARRGAVAGSPEAWEAGAATVAEAIVSGGDDGGALLLHPGGGGPDAALALAPLVGLLAPDDPRAAATLGAIATGLGRGGLLDRYQGTLDEVDEPCAPFLFPTFWLAAALERCGGDGAPWLASAASARGPLGLMGEVADPERGTPLGNYPQVQSHAALVLALTER